MQKKTEVLINHLITKSFAIKCNGGPTPVSSSAPVLFQFKCDLSPEGVPPTLQGVARKPEALAHYTQLPTRCAR